MTAVPPRINHRRGIFWRGTFWTIKAACAEVGLNVRTFDYRRNVRQPPMSIDEALETPTGPEGGRVAVKLELRVAADDRRRVARRYRISQSIDKMTRQMQRIAEAIEKVREDLEKL